MLKILHSKIYIQTLRNWAYLYTPRYPTAFLHSTDGIQLVAES